MHDLSLPSKEEEGIDQQIIKYLEEGDSGRRETNSAPLFLKGNQ